MKPLSYREFSNIFGDLGVTYWTKYNYLENPFKNRTVNGITNITITNVTLARPENNRCYAVNIADILTTDNNTAWCYGWSNYEIISNSSSESTIPTKPSIAITNTKNVYVNLPGVECTKEAYDRYLAEHPLIIYYYSSNTWSGFICDTVTAAFCFYQDGIQWPSSDTGRDFPVVRDVQGKYKWVGNLGFTADYDNYPEDLLIGCGSGGRQTGMHRIYFKDTSYNLNANEFKANELPRAVVWTKTADAVAVANEEETK